MVVKIKAFFEKTRHIKNIFYVDIEIQDIMKKYYQIKRKLIIQHNFVISICLNYEDKTDFLYYQESIFYHLIMHVLKYCYIENATDGVNYTKFYTRVYNTV